MQMYHNVEHIIRIFTASSITNYFVESQNLSYLFIYFFFVFHSQGKSKVLQYFDTSYFAVRISRDRSSTSHDQYLLLLVIYEKE